MAKLSRPGFWTNADHSNPEAKWIERATYDQLKRELPALMKEYNLDEVTVIRSKRGEWGDYFVKFTVNVKGKLVAGNSGWL